MGRRPLEHIGGQAQLFSPLRIRRLRLAQGFLLITLSIAQHRFAAQQSSFVEMLAASIRQA